MGEIAGKRIVEIGKVTPNDAYVERAEDGLLRLAVEEKSHRRVDATRRLGAEARPARGVPGPDRNLMPAFAACVAHDDIEGQRAGRVGEDGYRDVVHRPCRPNGRS